MCIRDRFHHEGYIPDSAIKACIQAQKNGHKVILCTGRQRIEIFGPMLEIDYDAIIAGSGATIECEHKIVLGCIGCCLLYTSMCKTGELYQYNK